tara:strand:- start:822 stop:1007 length:186 start_codon:yes stop_codon:yes gene_type:complete
MKRDVFSGLCGAAFLAYLGWMGVTLFELHTLTALLHADTEELLKVVENNTVKIKELAKYYE